MNFLSTALGFLASVLLPMFFRPKKWTAVIGFLHVLLVALLTAGIWFVHDRREWSRQIGSGPQWFKDIWSPLLFLLFYALLWFSWWLWQLFQVKEDAGRFPDLDACWNEALAALQKAGISLGDTPIHLVLGKLSGDEASLFQAGTPLPVNGVPGAGAPLRVFAHRDAIYISCPGASLLSRQSDFLHGPTSAAMPSATGSVAGGIGMNIDKSIGMSMAGAGPVRDVQQIIRRAREENRSLTAEEHRLIRELSGVDGGAAPAAPRSHGSVLKNPAEADELDARLRHVCRLIGQSRWPLCPINSVVLLVSIEGAGTDDDAIQLGMVGLRDLQAVRVAARLHCPVYTLVGDLELMPGASEFLAQFPADKRRQRLGKSFPLVPDVPPDTAPQHVETTVKWIFDALLPFWVFKLFRVEPPGVPAVAVVSENAQLFHFMSTVRERATRLSRAISRAVILGDGAPPLFGGCYLAGNEVGAERAFVPGFLKRLEETQGSVAWSSDAFDADASYRTRTQLGYAALMVAALVVIGLGVWWAAKSA